MKISIITVSFNSISTIEKTILSVYSQTYSNLEYIIVVEDDMYMDFPVKDIQVVNGKVMMTFTDPTDNKLLFVIDFYGPIYDRKTKAKVYQDSSFQNINGKNYQQVAKTHGIPMLKPMS